MTVRMMGTRVTGFCIYCDGEQNLLTSWIWVIKERKELETISGIFFACGKVELPITER